MSIYVEGSKEWLYGRRVLLYRLKTSKKQSYYARFNIPDIKGFIVRSLKTTSYHDAIVQVELMYRNMLHKASLGLTVKEVDWNTLYESWYIYHRDTVSRGVTWLEKTRSKQDLFFSPFFGDKQNLPRLALLNHTHIQRYWEWRSQYWNDKVASNGRKLGPPGWKTIQWEMILLKNIFRYAHNQGFIPSVPDMKHPMHKPTRTMLSRAKYTKEDYVKVISNLKYDMKHRRTSRERHVAEQLIMVVNIIAKSGVRVQELKHLEYRHIQLRYDDQNRGVTVIVIPAHIAKTRTRREAICIDGSNVFNMVSKWREKIGSPDDTSLVLQGYTDKKKAFDIGQAYATFIRRWSKSDNKDKVLSARDMNGRPYTLTSWRHSYVMMMISRIEVGLLAEQLGTSIEQIYKSYSTEQNWNNRLLLTSPAYRQNVWGVD